MLVGHHITGVVLLFRNVWTDLLHKSCNRWYEIKQAIIIFMSLQHQHAIKLWFHI